MFRRVAVLGKAPVAKALWPVPGGSGNMREPIARPVRREAARCPVRPELRRQSAEGATRPETLRQTYGCGLMGSGERPRAGPPKGCGVGLWAGA